MGHDLRVLPASAGMILVKTNGKNLVGMTIDDGHHERPIDGDMVSYYLRKIDDDEPLDFE